MKQVIKEFLRFCKDTFLFLYFLMNIIRQKSFSNPITKKYSGSVAVLANGPSLKEVIPHLCVGEEFNGTDFIAMNFFAFDGVFFKIKPKHYCLADPMFFKENHRINDVRKLFEILQNKVDWELSVYIPKTNYNQFVNFSGITNKKIVIIGLNCVYYTGIESFRYVFYKKGLAMPSAQTVANMAIYVALNCNYSKIRLYGVDHTFFDSLYVNEDNQLCMEEKHFYDDNKNNVKPVLRSDNGKCYKISEYCEEKFNIFYSHDLLEGYAKYLNVNILNCTKNSLIDSYDRK